MMRIDKYLAKVMNISRSECHKLIKGGNITVNGNVIKDVGFKCDELNDEVCCDKELLCYKEFEYYILNKPAGVITATNDKNDKTVMDLFPQDRRKDLSPVGRLDKDTEGLLLITDDGDMNHALMSPSRHVKKKYYVETDKVCPEEAIDAFRKGVDIGERTITKPARLEIIEDMKYYLTISEGKFHQVKRMFKTQGCDVTYLKRVSLGPLKLEDSLLPGQIRELTPDEIDLLLEIKER